MSLYSLTQGDWLCHAATQQSSYKLQVAKLRGTIYDCRKKPLTNNESMNVATIIPSKETANSLSKQLNEKERSELFALMKKGKPFLFQLNKRAVLSDDIDIFKVPKRYSINQQAPHIIGYLNGSKDGVSGIEKAYNDYLKDTNAVIEVRYKVDAINRVLTGVQREVTDKSYLQTKGVMLTIDSRLQKIAQSAAQKYLHSGAVVITEVPNCKIRASVSIPNFSPNNITSALKSENSPLLNRAITKFDVGSTFKLVTIAAALESGIPENFKYNCTGSTMVDGTAFHCFDGHSHKVLNMNDAIAHSCNTYFIEISKQIGPTKLLSMAKSFGFGSSYELAPGLAASAGILPSKDELKDKKRFANFSFGQGRLMATPLQIAGMINTIASNGEYHQPCLVEGLVNENLEFVKKTKEVEPRRVISEKNAQKIQQFMLSSVEYGTSKKGKPEYLHAAAKTATAQTGIKSNGQNVIQAWYAGFYPYENPKYCIVILAENGVGGGESCGPIFKKIADDLYKNLPTSLK